MKNKGLVFALIPLGIFIVIAVFLWLVLQDNVYFTNGLSTYTKPVCSIDRHTFTGETCPECSRSIKETGVFFKTDDSTNKIVKDRSLPFKKYYKSYKDFKKDYDNMLLVSHVLIIVLFITWISMILLFFLPRIRRFH